MAIKEIARGEKARDANERINPLRIELSFPRQSCFPGERKTVLFKCHSATVNLTSISNAGDNEPIFLYTGFRLGFGF